MVTATNNIIMHRIKNMLQHVIWRKEIFRKACNIRKSSKLSGGVNSVRNSRSETEVEGVRGS